MDGRSLQVSLVAVWGNLELTFQDKADLNRFISALKVPPGPCLYLSLKPSTSRCASHAHGRRTTTNRDGARKASSLWEVLALEGD